MHNNGLPWTRTWGGRLMSVLTWLEVVLPSSSPWAEAMLAMRKAIHRVYATGTHDSRAPMKAAHALPYDTPPSVWRWPSWHSGCARMQTRTGYNPLLPPSVGPEGSLSLLERRLPLSSESETY